MAGKFKTVRHKDNYLYETLTFDDVDIVNSLCGEHDNNLKCIEKSLSVTVSVKGHEISIGGDKSSISRAKRLIQNLYFVIESGHRLSFNDIEQAIKMMYEDDSANPRDVLLDTILVSFKRRAIRPKSFTQKQYVDAMRSYDIVIGIGPAGTGKTYLAMAMALASLLKKEVDRIILTRPAVEAGEKLGFLPGDLYEKVNPYLRPLYDALHDMMEMDKVSDFLHQGVIEVAPLAFMRGRTLNDSFVILDEAQNTTSEQMKMFLTRLGFNSKAVITGDITQIDLPAGKVSGLIEAKTVLSRVPGIRFVYFTEKDVVRHPLVQEIVKAYESYS
ncbi:MAG: PhoH family protein [Proteobacteria bacterium]|nr:PhoH family protein [Pseudomonadota bacterium]